MTSETPHLSCRSFVEKSALAFGLMGPLAAAKAYGAGTTNPPNIAAANLVNARQYGAKGDDATDDTKALQTALDAAQINGPIRW